MLQRIIEFSLKHRLIVILAILALVFLGVTALINSPAEFLPDSSSPVISVLIERPGLAPQEVESLERAGKTLFREGFESRGGNQPQRRSHLFERCGHATRRRAVPAWHCLRQRQGSGESHFDETIRHRYPAGDRGRIESD